MKIRRKTVVKLGGALSALIVSFGLVFGLAAFNTTSLYVDFDNPHNTISYFDNTPQKTVWNAGKQEPFKNPDPVSFTKQTTPKNKFDYAALVIDGASHQVLDRSFNQSGYQGLVDWIWTNDWYNNKGSVEVADPTSSFTGKVGTGNGAKPMSDNVNDFWQTYDYLVDSGHKTLVLPGYMHQNALESFKNKSSDYTKSGYILLDANTSNDPNIASVVFRADESAFMTGIATCQYLNDNFDEYKDGGLRVGTFGGVDIPSVTIYMGGFEYGVKVWNDYIDVIADKQGWTDPEEHKVNIINLGVKDSWFSNSFSIGDGKPLVKALLQRGADAILPVAGPQTVDTVQQIKASGSNCIVVGVDTAQENDPSANDVSSFKDKSGNKDIIKFSATKNIAGITSEILSLSYAGWKDDQDGNEPSKVEVGSFGYLTVGDETNDGIMPSENSWPYLIEFLENFTEDKPGEDQYKFILEHLEHFPNGEDSINFFDPDHLSAKEFMQLRI